MPLPLKEFVQHVLLENDRAARMYEAVRLGWIAACEKYPERGRWRRKATFRALVWEEAVRELAQLGGDDPDISWSSTATQLPSLSKMRFSFASSTRT